MTLQINEGSFSDISLQIVLLHLWFIVSSLLTILHLYGKPIFIAGTSVTIHTNCKMFDEKNKVLSQYIRETYGHKERKGHPQIA